MSEYREIFDSMKCRIPAGKIGEAEVAKFRVTKEGAAWANLSMMMNGTGERQVNTGHYTRLVVGKTLMMSDTRAERNEHIEAVRNAKGSVLITGLGLGMVAQACLKRPEVTDVTVIEKSADVIALVKPHLPKRGLTVIHADAFEWKPMNGEKWGMVWHDIWPDICSDNLVEMGKLCRKFARRAEWQSCWNYDWTKRLKRQERDSYGYGW
jgi:hypothetical protein